MGPIHFLTCSVNVGSHLAASSPPMESTSLSPIASPTSYCFARIPIVDVEYPPDGLPANMLLSLIENVISIQRGRSDGHRSRHRRFLPFGGADRPTAGPPPPAGGGCRPRHPL